MKFFTAVVLCIGILSCNANPTDVNLSEKLAFKQAVLTGDVNGLRELFEDKDVNKAYKHGRTSFHFAAEHGNTRIVNFFLEKGADVNFADDQGLTPVHYAALNPNEKVLEILIKNGGDVNKLNKNLETPSHVAALNPNEKVLGLLIDNGANVSSLNVDNTSTLHVAAANGNEKVIELLLKQNLDPNQKDEDDNTPLHVATFNSNEKIAEKLIKAGANVNAHGSEGYSPIFYAIISGNKALEDILFNGADEHDYISRKHSESLKNHLDHPIHEHANEKIIELLLNNGVDVNQRLSDKGMTPYEEAVAFGEFELADFLVEHGAVENKELRDSKILQSVMTAVLNA